MLFLYCLQQKDFFFIFIDTKTKYNNSKLESKPFNSFMNIIFNPEQLSETKPKKSNQQSINIIFNPEQLSNLIYCFAVAISSPQRGTQCTG